MNIVSISLDNCVQWAIYQQVSSTGARSCFLSVSMYFTLLAAKTIASISGKSDQRRERASTCIHIYFSNSMQII